MPLQPTTAAILVLSPNVAEGRQIATWLSSAGLGAIATARTCDEAIFILGSRSASLLIVDEQVNERSERRLLQHMASNGHKVAPTLVRLIGEVPSAQRASGLVAAKAVIQKPLVDENVVQHIGMAIQRKDLITQFRQDRDQSRGQMEAARRMQVGLLPTPDQLLALQTECGVGVGSLYRSGDAVGGDLWGIWPVGDGRFALAIVDFAGHGLSAALNTFRLHALLSDMTLPRADPSQMTTLLNQRLHALLPRGQYATMIYLVMDAAKLDVVWCCAGGPHPMVVSSSSHIDLHGAGLPLGVKADTVYPALRTQLPDTGILCVFSDGLFESGGQMPDVPRSAIAQALEASARQVPDRQLGDVATETASRLGMLRESHPCPDHSDDIMAICIAFAKA